MWAPGICFILCILPRLIEAAYSVRNIQATSERPSLVPPSAASVSQSHLVFTDAYSGGHRLAEVFKDSEGRFLSCNMVGDRKLIGQVLSFVPIHLVDRVNKHQMDHVVHQCTQRPRNVEGSYFGQLLDKTLQGILAFPGTKWCGAGNVARNYTDLGEAPDADVCCRDHDFATESIPPHMSSHGLQNQYLYTMTSCTADKLFFNCLAKATSVTALSVGVTYFDILRTKCYKFGHPTKCVDKERLRGPKLRGPCKQFKIDIMKLKKWRIYDPPNFFEAFFKAKVIGKNARVLWTCEE
ncbi:phospholipase A2-like isoform X1 [Dermacentor andersoni]|uniref:phospholipase A2-like isoform X1 n=2 Tax=Dermacentor andersoni TaxID=34620 RepID=UPI003B3B1A66